MATSIQNLVPPFFCYKSSFPSLSSPIAIFQRGRSRNARKMLRVCRAMVEKTVQGASSTFAKDMERLSAKESLLLAFKDAGGFEALVTGRTTDVQCIDVNERIIGLERLNPTPRPTTCPNLEGRWNFEWFGVGSPVLVLAKFLFGRIPSTLANLSKLDVLIKDGCGTATAQFKLLNSIENKFIISTKYNVEGPLRMKEEYVEGAFESPKVNQEAVPEQLRGAFGQAFNTVQQIPFPIRDAVSSGMKVPLGGTFQRLILISYLDDEILIVRNTAGEPEVLTRLEAVPDPEKITEYES
ncbi:putative plastid-lipid-associated protein 13, chloroplastic isoform X2 [Capsicum chacoense]|uniref:Plastid-lipid-associated protein 13, chloroplastic n=1 Tax=Capsicum annuum TaxID=4072 RepID=A0A1U8G166_CAPAN|nr:probable plastid-lipid-associated protein 13, chloroplastic isoform X2 [Capsicum annuum]KAF3617889.1 putative plastid-lipid-associated protein 13, chloroplastic [Capsicum annuum]PHT86979.1 putative plastid-lipid-associated protein 13, chloroplastic [Capsicum annuum]